MTEPTKPDERVLMAAIYNAYILRPASDLGGPALGKLRAEWEKQFSGRHFWVTEKIIVGGGRRETVRSVIARLEIPPKRAWYILEKWEGRGWYDYGVSLDLGWLTPEGLAVARAVADADKPKEPSGACAALCRVTGLVRHLLPRGATC